MPSDDYHNRYVMLENHHGGGGGGGVNPPPYRRNIPKYHGYDRPRRSKCVRCICCCCCCIFIFILVMVLLSLSLFLFIKPQMPSYSIDTIHVSHFDMQGGVSKVYTEFNVVVKANNPNSDIGFEYGKGSAVNIIYSGTQISSGQIPAFFQPGKNITMINILLKGQSDFEAIQNEHMMNQKAHKIPLLVKVKIPVALVLHGIQLREFTVYVNCSLVSDDLKKDKDVKILSSQYTYDFQL